ncbi:hypothetical protein IFM89_001709 [Coptis chinensis]|uniref:Plantacyanin n=1 Tax=Coptis chinensis TaxID=261450 RepID=A0A835HKI9_9MAGN|nr:hypothetical protein IFM89_001709 [Coptis chinensis]
MYRAPTPFKVIILPLYKLISSVEVHHHKTSSFSVFSFHLSLIVVVFLKMVQGTGSANHAVTIAVTLLVLLVHCEIAHAAIYTVGDARGWTFNTVSWPTGKTFRAGDVLVFKYNPSFHNVVVVDPRSYNTCRTPRGAKVLKSGTDRIRLAKGLNSFICNYTGHCESGMKITVNAI